MSSLANSGYFIVNELALNLCQEGRGAAQCKYLVRKEGASCIKGTHLAWDHLRDLDQKIKQDPHTPQGDYCVGQGSGKMFETKLPRAGTSVRIADTSIKNSQELDDAIVRVFAEAYTKASALVQHKVSNGISITRLDEVGFFCTYMRSALGSAINRGHFKVLCSVLHNPKNWSDIGYPVQDKYLWFGTVQLADGLWYLRQERINKLAAEARKVADSNTIFTPQKPTHPHPDGNENDAVLLKIQANLPNLDHLIAEAAEINRRSEAVMSDLLKIAVSLEG